MASPAFQLQRVEVGDGAAELRFAGDLGLRDAERLWRRARELTRAPARVLRFDLSGVSTLDGGSAALILQLAADLRAAGRDVAVEGARGRVAEVVDLYRWRGAPEKPDPGRMGFLDQVGRATLAFVAEARAILDFAGRVVLASGAALRAPGSVDWRALPRLMERAGADALPIVVLITFLMGLVAAFQAAVQLKQVGANIFVADLVALSITRELGPLMTAIIAAGRSGASFAAELGTMEVSEEVDALHTLGLDPLRYLVFPRVLALVLVMPLLVLIADLVGILGGQVVAQLSLDLTAAAYWIEARSALTLWDVFSGCVKGVFFAAAVGIIACQRGLATRGGAEGVGRSTTAAVVTTLFFLILIDAGFTALFHVFGV